MPVFNNALAGAAGSSGAAGYKIERSLRFNRPDTPSLSKTFSSAGNQSTWTWSAWVKRGEITTTQSLFACYAGTDNNDGYVNILFNAQNKLSFSGWSTSYAITNRVFRDPSAWYHIVIAVDQTQSNASDRIKIYVNGVAETFSTYNASRSSYPINSAIAHNIGSNAYYSNATNKLQGYLAEVHFVDGQQLAATDFGEVEATTGVWNPIEYTGSHGPAVNQTRTWSGDATATGQQTTSVSTLFNGILSTNGDHWTCTGNGTATLTFSPALPSGTLVEVWGYRNGNYSNVVKINGTDVSTSIPDSYQNADWNDVSSAASSGISTIEITRGSANPVLSGIRVDGVLLVDSGVTVSSNGFYLDFSNKSSNAALGYDAAGSNNWTVNNLVAADNVSTSAITNVGSTTGTVYYSDNNNNAYDPNNLTVFSSGQHSTGSTNMRHVKIADLGSGSIALTHVSGNNFYITGSNTTTNTNSSNLVHGTTAAFTIGSSFPYAYARIYAGGNGDITYNATVTGPTYPVLTTTNNDNYSSLAVGNSNVNGVSITAINSSTPSITVDGGSWSNGDVFTAFNDGDSVLDSPTNYEADSGNNGGNYATLNPLANSKFQSRPLSNGNLDFTGNTSASSGYPSAFSTIGMTSGKFYCEATVHNSTDTNGVYVGVCDKRMTTTEVAVGSTYPGGPGGNAYSAHGKMEQNSSVISTGNGTYTGGDVIGIAYDADNGKLYFSKNGTFVNSANPAGGTNPNLSNITGEQFFVFGGYQNRGLIVNFGQRPFNTAPPTGYKALCTQNLPNPTITNGSDYFDVDLYSGTGNALERSEFSFKPDFLWIKRRSSTRQNTWIDNVRGVTKRLFSDSTESEATASNVLTSFDADGFTLGTQGDVNAQNETYVAWAWDAGDAANPTSVSAGGLNSSAYNQSQTWSSSTFFNANGNSYHNSNNTITKLFDGTANSVSADGVLAASGGDFTLSFGTTFSSASTVTFDLEGGGNALKINGSFVTLPGGSRTTVTYNVSGLTSIQWYHGTGSTYCFLLSIKVDGKELVDSGVTPPVNVPSVATSYRANQTAGFSVVTATLPNYYTNYTIAHGLNATPHLIIGKNRAAGNQWDVYHKDVGTGKLLRLNQTTEVTNATANQDSYYPTAPDSNVFGFVGNNSTMNFVWYVFSEVEGFSAVGTYESNGGYTGPFVYTGFRPKWVMVRNIEQLSSNAYNSWSIFDSERDTYNSDAPPSGPLYANRTTGEGYRGNATTEEGHESIAIDFLSNGFLPRYNGSEINGPADKTYVYLAMAENPFKISRAR